MLLLFLEIGLTIAAWNRGWKGWALLPMGCAIGAGYFLGMIIGADGGAIDDIIGLGLLIDVLCVIALIIMVSKPHGVAASSHTTIQPVQRTETTLTSEPINKSDSVVIQH
jgi:hypothetical protein